jgi:hypothetical protein
MAEGQGFEPWVPLDTPVFKTGAFDHSAIPPVNLFGGSANRNCWSSPCDKPFFFNVACLKKCGDYTVVLLLNKAEVDELFPQFFKGF